jgi:hypothetical protein
MVRMIIAIASADGNFRLSGKNRSRPKSRRNYESLLRNSRWNNGFTNPAASGSFAVVRQAGPGCGCQHRRKAAGHRLQTRNSLQPCQLAHPMQAGPYIFSVSPDFGLRPQGSDSRHRAPISGIHRRWRRRMPVQPRYAGSKRPTTWPTADTRNAAVGAHWRPT